MSINQIIQQKNMVSTYPNRGLTIVEGQGPYLFDEKGNKYLDFMSNYGVNILGYQNEAVGNALKNQIDKLTNLHCSLNNDSRSEALKKLVGKLGKIGFPRLKRVYWSSSGAEAVEAAIKFAILATGRSKLLTPENDYHGKTLGSLSVTYSGGGKYQKAFKNNLIPSETVKFGDIEDFKSKISEEYAAFIMEPIQGEGGIVSPDEDYFYEVSKICKEKGVLLIVDEIQSGMGRTGHFINIEKYAEKGFECDILCLAKGLGGGIPVAATIITDNVNAKIPKGIHTTTFGGNPLSMAGVVGMLDFLEQDQTIEKSQEVSKYLFSELNKIVEKYPDQIKEIRGEGMMVGIDMKIDPLLAVKGLQKEKILVAPTSASTFRLLPPIIITKDDVDLFIEKFDGVLSRFK